MEREREIRAFVPEKFWRILGLFETQKEALEKHYKVKVEDSDELIEKIGRKKGILKKGDEVNVDQTSREILRAWQKAEIKF